MLRLLFIALISTLSSASTIQSDDVRIINGMVYFDDMVMSVEQFNEAAGINDPTQNGVSER